MKIKLKVLKGSGAGKEVRLPAPKCLIGRGEDCHLRPKSEGVSRRHCVIITQKGEVLIRDLKSKNGTFVNGKTIKADYVLKNGDKVQVGPLAFEVQIDHSIGGEKKPKVKSIKEAAVRTTASNQETPLVDDSDISDWLDEADDLEREQRYGDPDTQQLMLDETDQGRLQRELEKRSEQARLKQEQEGDETKEMPSPLQAQAETEGGKKKKKKPGKLPKQADPDAADSGEAAAHVLRKFFNNR